MRHEARLVSQSLHCRRQGDTHELSRAAPLKRLGSAWNERSTSTQNAGIPGPVQLKFLKYSRQQGPSRESRRESQNLNSVSASILALATTKGRQVEFQSLRALFWTRSERMANIGEGLQLGFKQLVALGKPAGGNECNRKSSGTLP